MMVKWTSGLRNLPTSLGCSARLASACGGRNAASLSVAVARTCPRCLESLSNLGPGEQNPAGDGPSLAESSHNSL